MDMRGDWSGRLVVPRALASSHIHCTHERNQWWIGVGSNPDVESEFGLEQGEGWLGITVTRAAAGDLEVEATLAFADAGGRVADAYSVGPGPGNEASFKAEADPRTGRVRFSYGAVIGPDDYSRYEEGGAATIDAAVQCPGWRPVNLPAPRSYLD